MLSSDDLLVQLLTQDSPQCGQGLRYSEPATALAKLRRFAEEETRLFRSVPKCRDSHRTCVKFYPSWELTLFSRRKGILLDFPVRLLIDSSFSKSLSIYWQ